VTLANFAFSPTTLTVKVGTTVTWTNKDSTSHTVVSDTGVFDSGNLAPNATYTYVFAKAGTFNYHCSIHPSMKGTVIVQ
jgi:plastocyanin